MSKLSYEDKINIYNEKKGNSVINISKKETKEEQIKRLEEENLYLKAELEYSKKLRAVVQVRKNRQQKKKEMLLMNFDQYIRYRSF